VSANAAPLCPVCQCPDQGTSDCGQCGARLYSGFVVGAPSPSAQRELDSSIAAARRRYALRVAARAAAWNGHGTLTALAGLADGDTPASAAEIQDAIVAYNQEEPPRPAVTGVGFTLSRLVAGETDAIVFVEISPAGISAYTLVADELGVPRPKAGHESGAQVRWTDLLADLPSDDNLRLYQLAGGIGDPGTAPTASGVALTDLVAALTDLVAAATEREIATLMRVMTDRVRDSRAAAFAGHDVGMALSPWARPDAVLVCRTRRWPPLEAAAAKARAVLRPVAEIFAPGNDPLPAVVSEAARRAPLRYDYCLVLAAVDQQTGMVRSDARPLFPAGTTGHPRVHPTVDTAVMAPSAAADRLLLPVVARRGSDPAGWPAVGVGIMDGTAAGITQLRVRLEAPGRVRMSARPKLVPGDGSPSWPGVVAGLPAWQPVPVVADIVLLAELGGRPETVAHRMSLLEKVVSELDRPGVQVAVVGYREHWDRYYPEDTQPMRRRLVVGGELGDVADVRSILAQDDLWQAVRIRDRNAAPLEDALNWIANAGWAWRPAARHLLVMFASRPPHPERGDDRGEGRAIACQYGLNWQDILGGLRDEQAVECLAVLPEPGADHPASDYAKRTWAEFDVAGLFYAERSPTADLLRAMGIRPADDSARLPLAVGASDV
jgi:hypothetical protein